MRLTSLLVILAFLVSCKKDVEEETPISIDGILTNGLVVLCEGLFQQNNSTISWVDLGNSGINNNLFEVKANRSLGDTGNDMLRYGGKIYIAVNVSSTIEVVNTATFNPIKQIDMEASGVAKEPRYIIGYGGNVFVTCFDGYVDVIDTTNLTVISRMSVGSNPEGLAVSNNKLYVSNSGGLNPVMDSTVSVIDITSGVELYKISVGLNPGPVQVDSEGDIYVVTRGDYASTPPRMVRIDTQLDQVAQTYSFDASNITLFNNKFLISYYDFVTGQSNVGLFDPLSESMINATFMDLSSVTTLYDVYYSSSHNRIYVLDAMNFVNTGYVREFDISGAFLNSFHVGLNPTSIIDYD